MVNNVTLIQTIPYWYGVGQRTSPPVSKFHISCHLLYNVKNTVLPEAEIAKHLLIDVHFQRVRTGSKNSGNADFAVATDSTYCRRHFEGLNPAFVG